MQFRISLQELIRQKIKEDACKLAYEDVRKLLRESRERGEGWVKWQTRIP